MQEYNSTRNFVEAILLTGISISIVLLSIYVPVFFIIGIFIWTIPITIIQIRNGFKYSILSIVVTIAVIFLLQGMATTLGFLGMCGVLGPILGYCIKSKNDSINTIMIMTGATLLSMVLTFRGLSLIIGSDLLLKSVDFVIQNYNTAIMSYAKAGVPKDVIDNIIKNMPRADMVKVYIPSGLLISSAFISLVNYIATNAILRRLKYEGDKLKEFSQWYLSRKFVIPFISILIITYMLFSSSDGVGQSYYLNMLRIFQFLFIVTGLAALDYYMNKRNVPKGIKIIMLVLSGTTILVSLVFYIGIFDYMFNLRKLDKGRTI